MNKIVVNKCYGGFSLSEKAARLLCKKLGVRYTKEFCHDIPVPRHSKYLVEVVEELGAEANGPCTDLKVEETYSNIYRIVGDAGYESIETPDSLHWIVI